MGSTTRSYSAPTTSRPRSAGSTRYPTTYIIDRDGKIRNKKVGQEPTEDFEKEAPCRPAARVLKKGAGLAITP